MKLSTKGRYAVAALYDLARHYGKGPVSLKNIAERQMISEHYLEQLMLTLRKAGYVNSVRGSQGGYYLIREPSQITVGDIIRAMEGPIAPVDCLLSENEPLCERSNICVSRGVWRKMRDSINAVVDSVSLADLCRENDSQGDD